MEIYKYRKKQKSIFRHVTGKEWRQHFMGFLQRRKKRITPEARKLTSNNEEDITFVELKKDTDKETKEKNNRAIIDLISC